MWALSIVTLAVFAFIQLLFIADVLEQSEISDVDVVSSPAENLDGLFTETLRVERKRQEDDNEINWTAIFAPTIIYFVLVGLYTIATLFRGFALCVTNRSSPTDNLYSDAQQVDLRTLRAHVARIYLFDSFFDLIALSLGVAFLVLLIRQLNSLSATDELAYHWLAVFSPLLILILFFALLYTSAALRVYGEERHQRSLHNGDVVGAVCGGMLICCAEDTDALNHANQQRHDKRTTYFADKAAHACPCVFICTPSMLFGVADLIIVWLLYLLPYVLFGVLVAVAVLLQNTTGDQLLESDFMPTSLARIFIVLYVFESLLLAAALVLIATLFACYRNHRERWPRGRTGLCGAYMFALGVLVITPFVIAQQALLADRVDEEIEEEFLGPDRLLAKVLSGRIGDFVRGWHVTFLPAYLLFTVIIVVGYCTIAIYKLRRRAHRLRSQRIAEDDDDRDDADLDFDDVREISQAGSHYGVLS